MELGEAYKVLELTPGANEEAVRDARKLLAKVWHPDRHANDPELEKRAQHKLADINTAFEAIRDAKFPLAAAAKPKPVEVAAVPRAEAKPEPPAPPAADSNLELVPRRSRALVGHEARRRTRRHRRALDRVDDFLVVGAVRALRR